MPQVLGLADLNRATLARQMLLAREKTTALAALERLGGLQAQLAKPPFIALWSRLEGFRAADLTKLVRARKAVRATAMRGTLHLMSAKDYLALRPALQPMLAGILEGVLGERARAIDLGAVTAAARRLLDERPRTFEELRDALGPSWPQADVRAIGYAVRTHLPLVQVPGGDDARWCWPAAACFAPAESWLGRRVPASGSAAALVSRYLGAFGPATVRDAQVWSGVRDLRETFESLRPKRATFRD